jgi:exonuclease III
MDSHSSFNLDDLVRDPSFNFLFKLNCGDDPNEQNHDFLSTDLNDSPYARSSFHTNYYDVSQFSEKFCNNNKLSLLSLNIQSLPAKFEAFKELIMDLTLKNCTPDVICLQETWNVIDANLFALPGYQPLLFTNRSSSQGGGVGIYLKSGLSYNVLKDKSIFIDKLYESLFIQITTDVGKKIIIGSLYRPNSNYSNLTATEQYNQFTELLLNTLSSFDPSHEIILLGDMNIDVLKYDSSTQVSSYIDALFASGFLQTITKPTRCTSHSATLIDHAITNTIQSVYNTAILTKRISDHFPFVVFSGFASPKPKKTFITFRDFSTTNINNFKTALSGCGWDGVTEDDNPETAYNNFHDTFSDLHNTFFQPKTIRFNKNFHKQEKWMTQGLLISRQTKLLLEKQHAKNPSEQLWNKFKKYRNIYNTTIRACKKSFYAYELESNSKNLKKTWSILNEVLKKPKNKQKISSITDNGSLITDPLTIANNFNHFFTTIADEIASLINPVCNTNLDNDIASDLIPHSTLTNNNEFPYSFDMNEFPVTDT